MYRTLQRKNEGIKDSVVRFAQELVRTPSPSLQEGDVARLIEHKMQELEYDRVFRDEAGNVVGVMFGRSSEPTILLNTHMDTVVPDDEDGEWEGSPFDGRLDNGRLYGLGATDCKGGIATQVYAGALLKRTLLPLRGNLVVAATVAEENGRSVGVRHLIEKTLPELKMKPNFAILGECTGLGLYYGHDGWMEMEICVEGANPFHVDDAARAIYDDFESGGRRGRVNGGAESIAVYQPRFEDCQGTRRATLGLSRRLRHAESVGEIVSQVKHNANLLAQPAGAVAVEVMVREENQKLYTGRTTIVQHATDAWTTDPFHPFVERTRQALSAAGCEVRPGKWELNRLGMGTAGSVLVNEFKIPTIGYGPGMEEQAHARNEFVELDKLREATYGTASVVHSLIGIPVFGWTTDEI